MKDYVLKATAIEKVKPLQNTFLGTEPYLPNNCISCRLVNRYYKKDLNEMDGYFINIIDHLSLGCHLTHCSPSWKTGNMSKKLCQPNS